jgi:rhodanese-related sulfurtransferase
MSASIDRTKMQALLADHAQLVEVLPTAEYESEHLPGAINIPLRELGHRAHDELDLTRPVIVYCQDSL